MLSWKEHQQWERDWHGTCSNSYYEEIKQINYSLKMGLKLVSTHKTPFNFNIEGKSVLDIGGGPYSLLLKCLNRGKCTIVDPCEYPEWVHMRYKTEEIEFVQNTAEDFSTDYLYDEVWMYNVLQHVQNPKKIIDNAKKYGKIIRYFDWIETGVAPGHPHNLKAEELNKWFGGIGKVEMLDQNGHTTKSYYGIFKGDKYEG